MRDVVEGFGLLLPLPVIVPALAGCRLRTRSSSRGGTAHGALEKRGAGSVRWLLTVSNSLLREP